MRTGRGSFSAVDLVRFASAFDDPKNCKILKEESISPMFAPPEGMKKYGLSPEDPRHYYSFGWMNGPREAATRSTIGTWDRSRERLP